MKPPLTLHTSSFNRAKALRKRGWRHCGQVFDSGLIGEGILHLLAWARAKLLTPDATLVSPV